MTILSWSHAIRDIPEAGLAVERRATHEELAGLAKALDLIACNMLRVDYRVQALSGGRLGLEGVLTADVTQACVISLEPVTTSLSEPIAIEFAHSPGALDNALRGGPASTPIDPLEGVDTEPIEDGEIDVGRVVFEELASLIDPFPRKSGATFGWQDPHAHSLQLTPFGKLASLKDPKQN